MKKMIKLSLVAAVAVAGLTTSATAGSLSDAIKDTTLSGKAMVGYNVYDDKISTNNANEIEYDFDATLTTKVNDTISFTTGIQADHNNDVRNTNTDTTQYYKTWAEVAADAPTGVKTNGEKLTLTKLYFTAKTDAATVMIGKQGQPTPFLDDERGDGIVAIVPAGPVTVAAGHFTGLNGQSKLPSMDISAAAVIGTFGPVNASLWFLDASGDLADGYSLNLNGKFGPVNVDLTHTDLSYGDVLADESASLTKLAVSGKAGSVNLVAAYAMTNDDQDGRGLGVDLTSDDDSKTNFAGEMITLDDHNDASAYLIGASMTFGPTTVGAQYIVADVDNGAVADIDAQELNFDVAYAMSKNFSITAEYAIYDAEQSGAKIADQTQMELSLNYKF